MKTQINLITIWTNQIEKMRDFYSNIMGFEIIQELENYIEFKNEGVRFAICMRSVMTTFSDEYTKSAYGQSFELAFPCDSPIDVDETYSRLVELGAKPVKEPENMPWNQRTALFADPDGNIHEVFSELG